MITSDDEYKSKMRTATLWYTPAFIVIVDGFIEKSLSISSMIAKFSAVPLLYYSHLSPFYRVVVRTLDFRRYSHIWFAPLPPLPSPPIPAGAETESQPTGSRVRAETALNLLHINGENVRSTINYVKEILMIKIQEKANNNIDFLTNLTRPRTQK